MSLSIGELIGYLRIDDTGVDEGLSRSEQRLQGFKGAAGALGAAAGGAVGAGLSVAMGNAVDFQAGQAKLSAQLNLTSAESAAAGELAGSLYSQNWGGSLDEINEAIKGVAQNMGVEINSVDMEPLARQATILSDVFEIDLASSTRAAGNLMQHLGMDGQAAMDTIARVTQNGGARAEDLVDTLEEYPVQFAKLGLTGEQAMGIINQGMLAGARNTDIMGDALKEFSIRAIDGSKTSAEGYALMGLNAEQMTAQIARGGKDAEAGLQTVTDALRNMEDPVARDAAAVALFGTQSEDLGAVLAAIDPATAAASLGDFAGAADAAGNAAGDTATAKIETLRRQMEMFGIGLIETEGPLGMIAAGVSAFGPAALGMAGSLAMIGMAIGPLLVQLGAMVVSAATTAAGWAVSFLSMALNAAMAVGRILLSLTLWVAQTVLQGALAIASMTATAALYVAQWILMGAQATARAAIMALAWIIGVVTPAAVALASMAVTAAGYVAQWVVMAAGAMARAAIMAAAWFVALGPVGWVIAAVLGLVALIIANWDSVSAATSAAWNATVAVVTGAAGMIVDGVTSAVGWVLDKINMLGQLPALIGGFFGRAKDAAVAKAGELVAAAGRLPGQVVSAVGNLGTLLWNAGMDIVRGLWNGIMGMGAWLMSKITGWIRQVVPGPILSFLGIASPSKFMRNEVGRWIPEGLADGIIANARVAGDAARDMAMRAADGAQRAIGSDGAALELGGLRMATTAAGSAVSASVGQGDGQRVITINVHNPQAEKTSDSINRRASTLEALGAFG